LTIWNIYGKKSIKGEGTLMKPTAPALSCPFDASTNKRSEPVQGEGVQLCAAINNIPQFHLTSFVSIQNRATTYPEKGSRKTN
jgi:hypothetical protein